MWIGNVFSHVCVSVCVFVCLSVCVSVSSGYNFWSSSHILYHILGQGYVSRSLDQGQGHMKYNHFMYFNMLILCIWLQVINKLKVTHQGEGHIKVKVKMSNFM